MPPVAMALAATQPEITSVPIEEDPKVDMCTVLVEKDPGEQLLDFVYACACMQ